MSQPAAGAQSFASTPAGGAAQNVAHNLRITAELSRINEALGAACVPTIVLKGTPLMHRIGEGLSERRVADNDVLVHRDDVRAAVRALEPLGYRSAGFRNLERDLEEGFEHPLIRVDNDGSLLVCEVHWNAFPSTLFRVPERLLWERSVEVDVAGTRVRVFEPAMQLLHLVSHALQHELSEPRTLRTFGLAWNRWHTEVAHEELQGLARSLSMSPALEYVAAVTRDLRLTDAAIPAERTQRVAFVRRLVDSDRLSVNAEDSYPERYFRLMAMLLLVPPRRAVEYLFARALPKPDWSTRRRGAMAMAEHYLGRPFRPVLRSLGWRPPDGAARDDRLALGQLAAVLAYLRIHRRLSARYEQTALDELLRELEREPSVGSALSLDALGRAIAAAEKLAPRLSPTPNTCLFRALSRYTLLNAHEHPVSFVLGVGLPLDQPGHAWVEVEGVPFLESQVPSFPRILTRESRRA